MISLRVSDDIHPKTAKAIEFLGHSLESHLKDWRSLRSNSAPLGTSRAVYPLHEGGPCDYNEAGEGRLSELRGQMSKRKNGQLNEKKVDICENKMENNPYERITCIPVN